MKGVNCDDKEIGVRSSILKAARNCAIANAFKDGYTQAAIAEYLNVSAGLVSMVVRRQN